MRAYERFLNYIHFPTASDENSPHCPSTDAQLEFGRALVNEMRTLGIADAALDENGYVTGTIESNISDYNGPVIGFIAHMDVVRDVPYKDIRPKIIKNYDGSDIVLNPEQSIVLSPSEFESLLNYKGRDLIVADGTTLLGADDKCGIAEIMTMAEVLLCDSSIKHGPIKLGFTPDEEIGRGADLFDIARFGADFAYTVDGGGLDTVEYETFNAAKAGIAIKGRSIHPGSAKNKLINPSIVAMEYNALLPENERPEHTEGYEGFYYITGMTADYETAQLKYILRDHDSAKLELKKQTLMDAAEKLNKKYGKGTVTVTIRNEYRNMAGKIKPHWHLIENAFEALKELGMQPRTAPVRGGTDGARLSHMGLPCPNLGTGSHNHHGKLEYACIQAMDDCVALLIKLARKYSNMEYQRERI